MWQYMAFSHTLPHSTHLIMAIFTLFVNADLVSIPGYWFISTRCFYIFFLQVGATGRVNLNAGGTPPCINSTAQRNWLNRGDVRKALHIPAVLPRWDLCRYICRMVLAVVAGV